MRLSTFCGLRRDQEQLYIYKCKGVLLNVVSTCFLHCCQVSTAGTRGGQGLARVNHHLCAYFFLSRLSVFQDAGTSPIFCRGHDLWNVAEESRARTHRHIHKSSTHRRILRLVIHMNSCTWTQDRHLHTHIRIGTTKTDTRQTCKQVQKTWTHRHRRMNSYIWTQTHKFIMHMDTNSIQD
jgi:hypothetical protein